MNGQRVEHEKKNTIKDVKHLEGNKVAKMQEEESVSVVADEISLCMFIKVFETK